MKNVKMDDGRMPKKEADGNFEILEARDTFFFGLWGLDDLCLSIRQVS